MFSPIYLLLPAALMMLAAHLAGRRLPSSPMAALFEFAFDAALSASFAFMLLPLDRIHLVYDMGGFYMFLSRTYMALAPALFLALGIWQGRRGAFWVFEPDAPACPRGAHLRRAGARLLLLALIILSYAYLFGMNDFYSMTLDGILFHLRMPLAGTAHGFVQSVLERVVAPSLLWFLPILIWTLLPASRHPRLTLSGARNCFIQLLPLRVGRGVYLPMLIGWLCLLLTMGCRYLQVGDFIDSRLHSSALIEENYVSPRDVAIAFPEEPRNLITIYVESAETTFQDVASGGIFPVNLTPEMTRIAQENVSFSQTDQLAGAAVAPGCGWTIAGLVAQTSALPLKLYKYDVGVDNSLAGVDSVLPGATTLDDLLSEQGYRCVFMAGSDFTFAGRRQYFTQHGDVEIWDLQVARDLGKISDSYYVNWGFEDAKLYEYAREELSQLGAGDEPFHLSLLTADTHTPGYICERCPQDVDDPYLRTVACASRQLGEFLDWCAEQPFYENTVIVVAGDHSSMTSLDSLSVRPADYDKHLGSTDRLVYNAFIHPAREPVREKGRLFTTLDLFPSILSAMGAFIEGDRLGLGTDLFSGRDTLAEELGYDELFTQLNRHSAFYDDELLFP